VRFPRSHFPQRRNPPTQRLGDLPLEARVTERPSFVVTLVWLEKNRL